jgi:hypothetical protein
MYQKYLLCTILEGELLVSDLVGEPRMEDLTTFMCMADNGTTAARE